MYKKLAYSFILFLMSGVVLAMSSSDDRAGSNNEKNSTTSNPEPVVADNSKAITVTENSFTCLDDMHPVRGFFVANLIDTPEATIAAAEQADGAFYPAGSVVQLIPEEAMVKHHKGWNPATNDWEFFELIVDEDGTTIKTRGTTQVINKFGGNCFACHVKAEPRWDFICEENHGCDSLPIPGFLISLTQASDPRCK